MHRFTLAALATSLFAGQSSFVRSAMLLLGILLTNADALHAQSYVGVGGRYGQQVGAIQRNSTLASNGTTTVNASGSNRRVFVRFLADTGRNVTGFDIKMRYRILGESVKAWLYTADASNRPANAVASGMIGISTSAAFCRASFGSDYRIAGGSLYFMAFELPAGEDLIFSTSTGGAATTVTYFVNANGTAQNDGIQFRVNTDGFAPVISMTQPRVGQTFQADCSGAELNQPALLWLSINPTVAPVSLHSIGAPGSFLYLQSFSLLASAPAANNRSRSANVYVANEPGLLGLPVNLQWMVLSNSNAFGAVLSNAALSFVQ